MQQSIDIGKSFSHVFEDPDWGTKAILGSLIGIVPILNFTLMGYEVQVAKNVSKGDPHPMPTWDGFGDYFMNGLWLGLARIVYGLPVLILMAPLFFIFIMPIMLALIAGDSRDADRVMGMGLSIWFLVMGCSFLLAMLYSLLLGAIYPAITANYVRHGTFAACFDLKEIFAFIRRNFNNYLMVWVAGLGAGLVFVAVYMVVSFIPCIGSLLSLPLAAAGTFYIYMVTGHALGQALAFDAPPAVEPVQSAA